MKIFLKTLLAILVAIVIAGAIFLTNLIWFPPWSLNLFYEKTFVEVVFNEPELLTSLGLVEQFGISSHNSKLNDASSAHQQAVLDRWKKDLRQLHEYSLDRQTRSQKLSVSGFIESTSVTSLIMRPRSRWPRMNVLTRCLSPPTCPFRNRR